ncbi:MAG: homoserine O-acetyltransferase [Methanospirillum sp.]
MGSGSVGTVETRSMTLPAPLPLEGGGVLPEVVVAYETYGRLNDEKTNAVLVCHALSGDAHAAGHHGGDERPGWWDGLIGPGKALDTDRFFVICSNVISGCQGSTGPSSIDPVTGRPYGARFPVITVRDMVAAQRALVAGLGIGRLNAVIGGSMGGMQALQWTVSYPDAVQRAVVIAATGTSSPQQIAFNEIGRRAIMTDPAWSGGDYLGRGEPEAGLALARMVGHVTYLSDESMHEKFGRRLQGREKFGFGFATDFAVESYLHHQGESFTRRFDANSYLYITKALDYFDLSVDGSLAAGLAEVTAKVLVVSVSSDWLYPPYQSQALVEALAANEVEVEYCEIASKYGHDAFLLETGQLNYLVGRFLSRIEVRDVMTSGVPALETGTVLVEAARVMIDHGVNHLPVLGPDGALAGIVTSWDIAKAVAGGITSLAGVMTRDVITVGPDATVGEAAARMESHAISALPVVDEDKRVIGIVSSEALSRLVGRCR